jgi:hypothetical protein
VKNARPSTAPHDARGLALDAKFGRAPHGQVFAIATTAPKSIDRSLPPFVRVRAHVPDARRVEWWERSTDARVRAKLHLGRARADFERAS